MKKHEKFPAEKQDRRNRYFVENFSATGSRSGA
jgi:hypothetical protein